MLIINYCILTTAFYCILRIKNSTALWNKSSFYNPTALSQETNLKKHSTALNGFNGVTVSNIFRQTRWFVTQVVYPPNTDEHCLHPMTSCNSPYILQAIKLQLKLSIFLYVSLTSIPLYCFITYLYLQSTVFFQFETS